MNSLELMTMDWLGRGWLLILSFTAAVLVVVALRKPLPPMVRCRTRLSSVVAGAHLAMLASQLPHAASAEVTRRSPALVYMITSVASVLLVHALVRLQGIGWRNLVMLAWCAGMAISAADRRYSRSEALSPSPAWSHVDDQRVLALAGRARTPQRRCRGRR